MSKSSSVYRPTTDQREGKKRKLKKSKLTNIESTHFHSIICKTNQPKKIKKQLKEKNKISHRYQSITTININIKWGLFTFLISSTFNMQYWIVLVQLNRVE